MERQNAGTWGSRSLIWFFTLLLTSLFYWLLGFVLTDIGSIQGPDYAAIENGRLDAETVERSRAIEKQLVDARSRIEAEKSRQQTLRDSTNNSQTTMNQLLELQRLSLQQGTTPNEAERTALVESEELFLENQKEYQRLNQEISRLEEEVRQLDAQSHDVQGVLEVQRRPIREEYNRQRERHNLLIAMWKLVVLVPLLLVGIAFYLKYRSGPYWALIYAFGIAVIIKVGLVMHEYFPARYFKYVLILALLMTTLRILIYLLRTVAYPKQELLLRQYREAYESFLCPICSHPIRRGPLKFMSWTKRTIRRISIPAISTEFPDEPYTCPACSTSLYCTCSQCGATRHSLLPSCTKCGSLISIT